MKLSPRITIARIAWIACGAIIFGGVVGMWAEPDERPTKMLVAALAAAVLGVCMMLARQSRGA